MCASKTQNTKDIRQGVAHSKKGRREGDREAREHTSKKSRKKQEQATEQKTQCRVNWFQVERGEIMARGKE